MAQIIPIYINVDMITATLEDGAETDEAPIDTNSGGISSGLLWGVHGGPITNDPGGQVIVRAWSDVSSTRELYSVTLDFSGGATQASDLMSAGVPFFEDPYFTVEGDTTNDGEDIQVTFYIQAMTY